MELINNIIKFLKISASNTKEIEFLKYFFPIIAIVGSATFLYYGYKGVFFKSTINLIKIKGFTFSESTNSVGQIEGAYAVIIGISYILIGLSLLIYLGGISYYIWF